MTIDKLLAEVKIIPMYECSECHANERGDTRRISASAHSIDELCDILKKVRLTAYGMPIGWRSYLLNGSLIFVCPACKDKKRR